MIMIFDLDDTLYNEIDYVESGFNEVAKHLEKKINVSQEILFKKMIKNLNENGRGKIFDEILLEYNINNKTNIKKCLNIYRTHNPKIKLNPEALECLKRFKNIKKYIVTDGNKLVQKKKIDALNISVFFEKIFITHRYGLHHSKPSPYCFMKISEIEKKSPDSIIYIGDNPKKDFINIKKLGFKTIQILNGPYARLKMSKEHQPHIKINSLDEITYDLIRQFK